MIEHTQWSDLIAMPANEIVNIFSQFSDTDKQDFHQLRDAIGNPFVLLVSSCLNQTPFEKVEILQSLEAPGLNIYDLKSNNGTNLSYSLFFYQSRLQSNHYHLVRHVLSHISDIDTPIIHEDSRTILHYAIAVRDLGMVNIAAELGADFNLHGNPNGSADEFALIEAHRAENPTFYQEYLAFRLEQQMADKNKINKIRVSL